MPTLSIWNGCSQGGRQGVTEAVRYPADFDGIIVGAPAVNFVNLHAGRVAMNRSVNATPAGVIPAVKYPLIHQAVLAACDAKDGVADGVLENPGACAFDPKVLQCSAHEDSTCLSAAQVESATRMYTGARHPDDEGRWCCLVSRQAPSWAGTCSATLSRSASQSMPSSTCS